MKAVWALQDAKNKFSRVVDSALLDGPQRVTRRGRDCVMIVSTKDYQRLQKKSGGLVDFFQSSPLKGAGLKVERSKEPAREVVL